MKSTWLKHTHHLSQTNPNPHHPSSPRRHLAASLPPPSPTKQMNLTHIDDLRLLFINPSTWIWGEILIHMLQTFFESSSTFINSFSTFMGSTFLWNKTHKPLHNIPYSLIPLLLKKKSKTRTVQFRNWKPQNSKHYSSIILDMRFVAI